MLLIVGEFFLVFNLKNIRHTILGLLGLQILALYLKKQLSISLTRMSFPPPKKKPQTTLSLFSYQHNQ